MARPLNGGLRACSNWAHSKRSALPNDQDCQEAKRSLGADGSGALYKPRGEVFPYVAGVRSLKSKAPAARQRRP